MRPLDLFEQLTTCHAQPADWTALIDLDQQLTDRRIELLKAMEAAVTQPAEQPALDDQHGDLDRLCRVACVAGPEGSRCRNARPCRRSCD